MYANTLKQFGSLKDNWLAADHAAVAWGQALQSKKNLNEIVGCHDKIDSDIVGSLKI